ARTNGVEACAFVGRVEAGGDRSATGTGTPLDRDEELRRVPARTAFDRALTARRVVSRPGRRREQQDQRNDPARHHTHLLADARNCTTGGGAGLRVSDTARPGAARGHALRSPFA